MKNFSFTLRRDAGIVTLQVRAENYAAAERVVLESEGAPKSAIITWRIIPTARQIKRTKSLLRCI